MATKTGVRKAKAQPKRIRFIDVPGRRHRELIQDRRFGSEGKNLAKLRLSAVQAKMAVQFTGPGMKTPVTAGASNWVPLGPTTIPNGQTYGGARVLVTGRITGIAIDPSSPSTMYVSAARGGVWKTTDGGQTWAPKSDNEVSLAIGCLAMAPSDYNRLYAGTGEGNIFYYAQTFPLDSVNADYHGAGMLRSDDGGNTWTHLGAAVFTGAAFYRIAVRPSNPDTLLAATTFGLLRSTDGGTTWTLMTSGLPALSTTVLACCDVLYDPSDPNRAWCAFWGSGIYRTTNANAATPTWTKLTSGLPSSAIERISLAVAPSNNSVLFALIADSSDSFKAVYTTSDKGDTWSTATTSSTISVYGAYTSNIAVDISSPDIVYVSGVELYKMVKSGSTWTVTNIGSNLHADSHAFATHPTDHLTIFTGNDGGIYKSTDGGSTWDDSINEGLTITQFEFIGQHGGSDAMVLGGTQDNGSEMFRNHPAFYHSADGDGGQAGIDPSNSNNTIHTYYGASPERSTQGGKFGTYSAINGGLSGSALFYPPWTYDDSNSNNLAFGLSKLQLSAAQGTDSWPISISLASLSGGRVSAIHYVNSSLIYAGTSNGLVYKVVKSGSTWTATLISAAPLPARWIWDVSQVPSSPDHVVVAMSGYGTGHVWRGVLTAGTWTWTDVSGTAPNRLPDAPVNALQIEPATPNTMYVGTDVGVYRTTDSGANWSLFNDGLPNVAVYDLKLQAATRVLRGATHGRGLWERKLDTTSMNDVRLVVRDNIMDTGRRSPSPSGVPAAWDDPLRQVNLNDSVFWWQCADAKVDVTVGVSYQMPVSAVDYLAFETKLAHRNPQRGKVNHVFIQVHNRGAVAASNVTVKILYADASPGLPPLPSDFWTAFPGDSALPGPWTPIGAAKTIAQISPTRPEVVEWDWTPPMTAATHICLLVIVSCTADPLASKPLDIGSLVTQNRQVGLKNLHIIDPTPSPLWGGIRLYPIAATDIFRWTVLPKGWSLGVLLPRNIKPTALTIDGFAAKGIKAADQQTLRKQLGDSAANYDLTKYLASSAQAKAYTITGIPAAKAGWPVLIAFVPTASASAGIVHLVQQIKGQRLVGGNTFVLPRKVGL